MDNTHRKRKRGCGIVRWRFWALLGLVVGLALGVFVALTNAPTEDTLAYGRDLLAEELARLEEARALWQQQGLADYAFRVDMVRTGPDEYGLQGCVRAGEPSTDCDFEVTLLEGLHPEPLSTMEAYFDMIEASLRSPVCNPDNEYRCECDGFWYWRAEYHPELGYPAVVTDPLVTPPFAFQPEDCEPSTTLHNRRAEIVIEVWRLE